MENSCAKRVLIIGAGISGMHAINQFSSSKAFKVTCMEQLPVVGGLWNYSETANHEKHPVKARYTAVYKNLKINIPKYLMTFCGEPYPENLPSFFPHIEVKNYYDHIANKFQLLKYITFNTKVLSVRPKSIIGKEDIWQVCSMNVISKEKTTNEFDIVVVCSGMHSEPYIPVFEGMTEFKGKIMHSCDYRDPEHFRGKRVVVVGGGTSGLDIVLDLVKTVDKVWICMRNTTKKTLPETVQQVGEIKIFDHNKVIVYKNFKKNEDEFENEMQGKELLTLDSVDVVLFCTGYQYSYPFLNADCGVSVIKPGLMSPLYKDTICLSRQTLSFIGITHFGTTFIFEYKARFLKAFYEGKFTIPPYDKELLALVEKDNEKKKANDVDIENKPLFLPFYQFTLCNEMASEAGLETLHEKYEMLFRKNLEEKEKSVVGYDSLEYVLSSEGLYILKDQH